MTSDNMIKASAACLLEHRRSPISQPTREAEKGRATPGWICCILCAALCYIYIWSSMIGVPDTCRLRWRMIRLVGPLPSPWISVVWHLQRWVKSKVAAFALNNLTSHCLVCLWFIFHVNCLKLANVSWCQKLCGVQVRKPSDKAKAQSKSGLAVGLPNC